MFVIGQSETHYSVHMRRAWRNDRRDQSPFTGVRGHASPGDAIVVAGGDSVAVGEGPMGVKLVVLTIANRLVARHRHRIASKPLKIHFRPVEIVLHRRVRLLVEWHSNVKVRPLQNDVVPG